MAQQTCTHKLLAVQNPFKRSLVLALIALAVTAAGCGPKVKPGPATAPTETNAGAQSGGDNAANAAGGALGSQDETAGPLAGLLATRIVYFDFDSAVIARPSRGQHRRARLARVQHRARRPACAVGAPLAAAAGRRGRPDHDGQLR